MVGHCPPSGELRSFEFGSLPPTSVDPEFWPFRYFSLPLLSFAMSYFLGILFHSTVTHPFSAGLIIIILRSCGAADWICSLLVFGLHGMHEAEVLIWMESAVSMMVLRCCCGFLVSATSVRLKGFRHVGLTCLHAKLTNKQHTYNTI